MTRREFDLVIWGATGFTGRLVAEMLSGAEPHIDPTPYRPERFNG